MSHFMHIPFPEELSDELWAEKWAQLRWLMDEGYIGYKEK